MNSRNKEIYCMIAFFMMAKIALAASNSQDDSRIDETLFFQPSLGFRNSSNSNGRNFGTLIKLFRMKIEDESFSMAEKCDFFGNIIDKYRTKGYFPGIDVNSLLKIPRSAQILNKDSIIKFKTRAINNNLSVKKVYSGLDFLFDYLY